MEYKILPLREHPELSGVAPNGSAPNGVYQKRHMKKASPNALKTSAQFPSGILYLPMVAILPPVLA